MNLYSKKLNNKLKSILFQELNILLTAGLDLNSSLTLMIDESSRNISGTIKTVKREIVNGSTLSNALVSTSSFSAFEINAVQIGEETGSLPIVTKSISEYYENKNKLKKQFSSALSYPALVILTATIVLYFMLTNVVPMFGNIFTRFDQELPQSTQFILNLSFWLKENQIFFASGIMLSIFFLALGNNNIYIKKKLHFLILKLPFIGNVVRQYNMASFSQSMYLLLSSKVPLDRALILTTGMLSFYPVKMAVERVVAALVDGQSLTDSMRVEKVFAGKVLTMVGVGESVNQLGLSFNQLSIHLKNEMDHFSKMLNTFLEPALILFVALIVGFILVSMYLPLFSLSSAIS